MKTQLPPPDSYQELREALRDLCGRYDLVATGGSDFHGPHTGRVNPPGTPKVPASAWEGIQERAARLS